MTKTESAADYYQKVLKKSSFEPNAITLAEGWWQGYPLTNHPHFPYLLASSIAIARVSIRAGDMRFSGTSPSRSIRQAMQVVVNELQSVANIDNNRQFLQRCMETLTAFQTNHSDYFDDPDGYAMGTLTQFIRDCERLLAD